jgi:hypothetical protein
MKKIGATAGANPLLGTWKLKSFVQVLGTGEEYNVYGEHPDGYISYSADGRMYAIVTSDHRPKPRDENPTDDELINLHNTMFAYAGTYTAEGDKVIHRVDVAWNQSFTGTEQVRHYRLDGNLLTVTTAPNKFTMDGREGHLVAAWEKVKPPAQ